MIGLLVIYTGCSNDRGSTEPPTSPAPKTQTSAQEAVASPSEAQVSSTEIEASPPEIPAASPEAQASPETQASTETQTQASMEPPASTEPEGDAEIFPVPEGTPDELFAFLESLAEKQPPARDRESVMAFAAKLGRTVVLASDRILAAKPSEEQTAEAVQYKLAGLGLLDQAGDSSVGEKRAAMLAELKAAGSDSLVRLVQLDGFVSRVRNLGMAKKEDFKSLGDDLANFFEQTSPEPQEVALAMQVAGTMERVFPPEEVAKYYERFGKVFAGSEDEQAAEAGAIMVGAARRMRLLGEEMPLDGVTLEGEELQWDQYRGKVVLVDFWATWCGPCIQEMANIRENYEQYHDQGFDVVGISADENRDDLVSFMQDNEIPWKILYDEDLKKTDRETMATRYGIMAYPTTILVGKDGKVIALEVRGHELGARLAELLGKVDPSAATSPEAPGESPAKTSPGDAP